MKWIIFAIAALLAAAVGLTAFLFTAPGNALLSGIIEKRMQEALALPARLDTFTLGWSRFETVIVLTDKNRIEADGEYSLLGRTLSARYRASLNNLEALKSLTGSPLRGALLTDGNLTGSFDALALRGRSDLAHSATRYGAEIDDYAVTHATLSVKDARIAELLYMGFQPAFAAGSLSVDADAAPVTPGEAKGVLHIGVADGRFDTAVMRNEFNVTLPKTDFTFKTDVTFDPKQADYTLAFLSNLAKVRSDGTVSPGSQAADLTYDVRFDELALLKPLTNAPLRGPFATKGSVKGDKKRLKIEGTSDVAGSETAYRTELHDLQPGAVTATIRHAALDRLLYLAGEDALAYGSLNADIDLKNLDPKALKGTVDAKLHNGKLNKTLIQKRFNTPLPATGLSAALHAALSGDTVVYDTEVDASLGHIASKGKLFPQRSGMDLSYALNVKELALFKGLTGQPLRGPLQLGGTLKGDEKRLEAFIESGIGSGESRLNAVLEGFKPASAVLKVKKLKLKKLLYTLGQPLYADADITVDADLPDLHEGSLDGKMTVSAAKGHADRAAVAKAFDWPDFKGSDFALKSVTALAGDTVTSNLDLTSDLATLKSRTIRYNVQPQTLTADYVAKVPDLGRLAFLTGRKMRGASTVSGELRYDKTLALDAESKMLGGTIVAALRGEKLHADLKNLNTLQAQHMLYYPEVFDSALNGTLAYNTASKKGEMKAALSKGRFTRNSVFDLMRQYTTLNLYAEEFTGDTLARIDDKMVDADLSLRSNRSSLKTTHAKIDTAAQTINANVHLNANNNPIDFRLKGEMQRPKVTIDAGKLIEREAGKQIDRLMKQLFK